MELLDANNEEQLKIIEKIKQDKAEKEKAAAKKAITQNAEDLKVFRVPIDEKSILFS